MSVFEKCPLPWTNTDRAIEDATGQPMAVVSTGISRGHDVVYAAAIVRRVNVHDELVAALEKALVYIDPTPGIEDADIDFIRDTLQKVKGEKCA